MRPIIDNFVSICLEIICRDSRDNSTECDLYLTSIGGDRNRISNKCIKFWESPQSSSTYCVASIMSGRRISRVESSGDLLGFLDRGHLAKGENRWTFEIAWEVANKVKSK